MRTFSTLRTIQPARMHKDGELHAEEDRKGKEELETRNEAENAVYRTETWKTRKRANGRRLHTLPHAHRKAIVSKTPASEIRRTTAPRLTSVVG